MTNAQEFNTLSRAYCLEQADKVVKECKECGGTGITHDLEDGYSDGCETVFTCDVCTPEADKRRKLADEFCWHEDEWYACHTEVCSCCSLQDCPPKKYHKYRPSRNNPTYSNPADIASALKRMRLFERFLDGLVASIWNALIECIQIDDKTDDDVWIYRQVFIILARILTTPALFLEAGKNFLREVVGQP